MASIIIESERLMTVSINHPQGSGCIRKEKGYMVFNYRSLFRLGEHTAKLTYQ